MGVIWSVTLREEHKLRVPENGVLRRIFGSKKEKWWEAGEDYIIKMRWADHVARMDR
jgi:hypothetical protein